MKIKAKKIDEILKSPTLVGNLTSFRKGERVNKYLFIIVKNL